MNVYGFAYKVFFIYLLFQGSWYVLSTISKKKYCYHIFKTVIIVLGSYSNLYGESYIPFVFPVMQINESNSLGLPTLMKILGHNFY